MSAKESHHRSKLAHAIFEATNRNDLVRMRRLLSAKAPASFDFTPLHFAPSGSMVVRLLNNSADVEALDRAGMTPLMSAVRYRSYSVVKALVKAKANVNAQHGQIDHPIIGSICRGTILVTKLLLDSKANPDVHGPADGKTPLMLATSKNDIAAVMMLIDYKADVNGVEIQGATALDLAYRFKYMDIHDLLFRHGALRSPKRKFDRLADQLFRLTYNAVNSILQSEEDSHTLVNSISDRGVPAIVAAAKNCEPDVSALLLHHGADINATDRFGRTALLKVLQLNPVRETLFHFYLEKGADPNVADVYGLTPLMLSTRIGRIDLVRALLDAKADATAVDIYGIDAQGFAAKGNYEDIFRLLDQYKIEL
jgi:ankyrin repeat protein